MLVQLTAYIHNYFSKLKHLLDKRYLCMNTQLFFNIVSFFIIGLFPNSQHVLRLYKGQSEIMLHNFLCKLWTWRVFILTSCIWEAQKTQRPVCQDSEDTETLYANSPCQEPYLSAAFAQPCSPIYHRGNPIIWTDCAAPSSMQPGGMKDKV